jgi:SpoU rRNA methylase family enzyme
VASEVAEANEVKEAVEVLRPEKSLLRTSESSRFLNSALF